MTSSPRATARRFLTSYAVTAVLLLAAGVFAVLATRGTHAADRSYGTAATVLVAAVGQLALAINATRKDRNDRRALVRGITSRLRAYQSALRRVEVERERMNELASLYQSAPEDPHAADQLVVATTAFDVAVDSAHATRDALLDALDEARHELPATLRPALGTLTDEVTEGGRSHRTYRPVSAEAERDFLDSAHRTMRMTP